MKSIKDIKEECRRIIELDDQISSGWVNRNGAVRRNPGNGESYDLISDFSNECSEFISTSRSFAPLAAKALLSNINMLESMAACACESDCPAKSDKSAKEALENICCEWNEAL